MKSRYSWQSHVFSEGNHFPIERLIFNDGFTIGISRMVDACPMQVRAEIPQTIRTLLEQIISKKPSRSLF